MATNRTPLARKPHGRVTPEAVEKFRAIRELEAAGVGGWEEQGGRRREWYNLRGTLHHLLGRDAGMYDISDCADPVPHPTIKYDDDYRTTHELYCELERLAGTPKKPTI